MELNEIKAFDASCPLRYCVPEAAKEGREMPEILTMTRTTFGGLLKKMGLGPGEEWKVMAGFGKPSLEAMIDEMDEAGVEKVVMIALQIWSRVDHKVYGTKLQDVIDMVKRAKGRIVGGVSYNPFRITESLREIEMVVKEHGFKYIWFHPISFGLRPDDRRCYPLYQKAIELGVPVGYQSGHSAEPLTSEPGRPMYADEVALDFPELTLILTHTGWPWTQEWIDMVWKHPNVYGEINAYYPSALDPALVTFMNEKRGQDKIIWGSHGFGFTRWKKEFLELSISDETKRKVLRDNPMRVLKLG